MAGNHLEALVAEWCEFNGLFVRRNVPVGRRTKGGWDCELDVVAFDPGRRTVVHVEPSLDSDSWERREHRYAKKREAGCRHIPDLFSNLRDSNPIDHVALFVYGGGGRRQVAGFRVMFIKEFMAEILSDISDRKVSRAAISEAYPHLRTLQFASNYWPVEGNAPTVRLLQPRPPATCRR